MYKILRAALVSTAVIVPLMVVGDRPSFSQERQGCFMVDRFGQTLDLAEICPQPETFATTGAPQELGTGDIQVTLRWATTDDLDLAVTDPSGNTVTFFSPSVPSGGQLDVDANAGCFGGVTTTPIENIFWPPSQAPQGNYQIEVNLFQRCNQGGGPIPFEVTLLVQGTTQTLTGTLTDSNGIATFPFSLPAR